MKIRVSRKGMEIAIPPEVEELIDRLVMIEGISREEALIRILEMGARYHSLKQTYGDHVDQRELWDRRFYYANVEAGYLYYRMRLGEVIGDFKSVLRILSTILGELENCYKRCGSNQPQEIVERKLAEYREKVVGYFEEYIMQAKRDLEEKHYVPDCMVVDSLRKILEEYKGKYGCNEGASGGTRDAAHTVPK